MDRLETVWHFVIAPIIHLVNRLKDLYRQKKLAGNLPAPDPINVLDARHEIGHAFIAWHITDVYRIWATRIHGNGGDTIFILQPFKKSTSLWTDILRLLGGIAGEAILTGEIWPKGARFDLAEAKRACTSLLSQSSSTVAPWSASRRCQVDMTQLYTEPLTEDERAVLNQCYDKACEMIRNRRNGIERAAQELARIGSLSHGDLVRLFGERPRSKRAKHERFGLIETENI